MLWPCRADGDVVQGNALLAQTAVRCSMLEQLECKHVMAMELCCCYKPNV